MDTFILDAKRMLKSTGGSALDFLVRVIIAFLIYFLIFKLLKKLLNLLEKSMIRHQVEPTIRHFVTQLIRYGVLAFTVITIIIQLDIAEASSIAALIASAGVGISLAMQGVLSNFAGGILLLMLHPFKEGDYIVVNDSGVEGTVVKIEIYYTTIRSLWGATIMIPNSELTNHSVTNKSGDHRRTLNIKVGISYQQEIRQAIQILQEIKDQEKRIAPGEGRIGVSALGDSSVELTVQAPVHVDDYYHVLWDMNEKIRVRFAEEGIEIPYQQLDVHIRKDE